MIKKYLLLIILVQCCIFPAEAVQASDNVIKLDSILFHMSGGPKSDCLEYVREGIRHAGA